MLLILKKYSSVPAAVDIPSKVGNADESDIIVISDSEDEQEEVEEEEQVEEEAEEKAEE